MDVLDCGDQVEEVGLQGGAKVRWKAIPDRLDGRGQRSPALHGAERGKGTVGDGRFGAEDADGLGHMVRVTVGGGGQPLDF